MTVVVTGGSGLVGSHVIAALVARGERVRALVRAPARASVERLGAEPVVGGVPDSTAWQALAAGEVRAIVHAAAIVQRPVTWEAYLAVNVEGTRLAARAARAVGARLVHVSSVAVYGGSAAFDPAAGFMTEDTPFRELPPTDRYARSKRLAEEAVRGEAAGGGLVAALIRPNVIYGERDRLFTPAVLRAVRLRVLPQVGEGRNVLSCVYAGNVAAAIMAALEAPLAGVRAFNVTTDAEPRPTQRAFLDSFARELGVRLVRIPVPPALATLVLGLAGAMARRGVAAAAVRFVTGDNPHSSARASRELGWRPPFTAAAAIARTVAWFREN